MILEVLLDLKQRFILQNPQELIEVLIGGIVLLFGITIRYLFKGSKL